MQKTLATLYVIFAAFAFSSLIYLIVGFTLSRSHWKPVLASSNLQQAIFWTLLAGSAGLLFLAVKFKTDAFGRALPSGANAEQTRSYLVSKYIVLFAIAEVPAIFGLVYFMLSGSFLRELILCLISIVIFLLVRPAAGSTENANQRELNEVKPEI